MDNSKTLKIVGIVASVVGAIASITSALVADKQQTIKINEAVAKTKQN